METRFTTSKDIEKLISAPNTSNFVRCCAVMLIHENWSEKTLDDIEILAGLFQARYVDIQASVLSGKIMAPWQRAGFGTYEDYRKAGGK